MEGTFHLKALLWALYRMCVHIHRFTHAVLMSQSPPGCLHCHGIETPGRTEAPRSQPFLLPWTLNPMGSAGWGCLAFTLMGQFGHVLTHIWNSHRTEVFPQRVTSLWPFKNQHSSQPHIPLRACLISPPILLWAWPVSPGDLVGTLVSGSCWIIVIITVHKLGLSAEIFTQ